jgi:hypothetical protein
VNNICVIVYIKHMNILDVLGYILVLFIIGICLYIYFDTDSFQLKCIISSVDGNKYCVRERANLKAAADLLAKTTAQCKKLVAYVAEKHPNDENIKRLVKGYNPQKIMETLPTSQYTAYSENKGEKLAFCLNVKKDDPNKLIDEHTLMFVAIHELSHVMTKSIGHKSDFWQNFKFLLQNAKDAGIHEPKDYKKQSGEYCSMKLSDNPFYDAK